MDDNKISLADLTLSELDAWIAENAPEYVTGYKFRGKQIYGWLGRGARSFDEMTNLPASLRSALSARARTGVPAIIGAARSARDGVVKYAMKTGDGNVIESVLLRYRHGNAVCVSTQAGCRMGCAFCATRPQSFSRSLTPGEMFGQVAAIAAIESRAGASRAAIENRAGGDSQAIAHRDGDDGCDGNNDLRKSRMTDEDVNGGYGQIAANDDINDGCDQSAPNGGSAANGRVSRVVVMGIGEPFDNYDNTLKFIRLLHDHPDINIGYRRVTVSTCGILPGILRLADEGLPVGLSLSLNAPRDDVRSRLMPVNNRYSIDKLIEGCNIYTYKTNRRVTFEYALIEGVNDAPDDAREVLRRIRGMLCHVNLIPVNPAANSGFAPSPKERVREFGDILIDGGVQTTVRRSLGTDIAAACGQLRNSMI